MIRAAVITVSTSRAAGEGVDESGPALAALVESVGAEVVAREVVPDDRAQIELTLKRCADELGCVLVLTSGGTGLSPNDVTPEATRALLDREAPGIAEAIRLESREHTPHWMLSRGLAGIRGRALIVNLPGNPASIDEAGAVLRDALPHALALLTGEPAVHEH